MNKADLRRGGYHPKQGIFAVKAGGGGLFMLSISLGNMCSVNYGPPEPKEL